MNNNNIISGQCHCGNISYQLMISVMRDKMPVRACGCSFCAKHGAVYTSEPQGQLTIHIDDNKLVRHYQFATKLADFIFCGKCGVMPFVLTEIEGKTYAVINANSSDLDFNINNVSRIEFSNETKAESIMRRKRNWISHVESNIQLFS